MGTPRSGTTFFCKTLTKFDNILIPDVPFYELFNPWALPKISNLIELDLWNQDKVIEKFVNYKNETNKKYFGFKTFPVFHHLDLESLVNNNDLDIIIVLRRDIWKIIGSQMIAIDNNDYSGSSLHYRPYQFQNTEREKKRVLAHFLQLTKCFWYNETIFANHKNFIEKIYLEDLSDQICSFEKINNYFDRQISFETGYNDNNDLTQYISNIEELKSFIRSYVKESMHHFKVLPEYLLIELDL